MFAEKLGDVDYIVDLATLTGAMIDHGVPPQEKQWDVCLCITAGYVVERGERQAQKKRDGRRSGESQQQNAHASRSRNTSLHPTIPSVTSLGATSFA